MRKLIDKYISLIDFILVPLGVVTSVGMRVIRKARVERLPRTLKVFRKFGVFPLRDHYYEPLFDPAHLRRPLSEDRELPGLDLNVDAQLDLLKQFDFNDELAQIPLTQRQELEYYFDNGVFKSGDAEYLYNMIRHFKPRRILEIGSGSSTLLATRATRANRSDDPGYACEHVCIEPYENEWLDRLDVTIIRDPVELLDKSLFRNLEKNDILFIDSSHMIRPQGDVLFEYLEILPILQPGVLIHIHDIFTPKDYLEEWVFEQVRFWNEQYLLEAFLLFNREFEVIGALNFLKHHYPDELTSCCPVLKSELAAREPGSFWMRRI